MQWFMGRAVAMLREVANAACLMASDHASAGTIANLTCGFYMD
ncbi:hypothetical protein [Fictibacillus fluitans]|uniref:Uncharacterized protein n=1 Tax=Fictibacillus fluitans TaxID=3058422 RepID=A0ABT8HXD4_9BACL|nr:hypothetical protein [Fictibacillus sp. NE201]MDN4525140.1 hypothetical protein [Fictibacillus sp. NE201]